MKVLTLHQQSVLDALPASYQPPGHHARIQAKGAATRPPGRHRRDGPGAQSGHFEKTRQRTHRENQGSLL